MFYTQLTQLVSEPTREGIPLDLLFVNGEGLVPGTLLGTVMTILILREAKRRVINYLEFLKDSFWSL